MDIYGYNAYQYNQSDELAKQMFAQQALATYNRSEPHAMPVPSGAPWNVQGIPWGMSSPPSVVQFTGQQPNVSISSFKPVLHCKRKSLDVVPEIPAKQLITEEKMAAHLSGLHISSDFTSHSLSSEEVMDVGMEPSVSVYEKLKGHKIVLSEEIKKLKDEPLLPAALIERLEKPCMSLVVWKPKENIVEKKIKEEEDKAKSTCDEAGQTVRRNGVLVPDLSMDIEM